MSVYFCDSTSKYLTSTISVFHSWLSGDVCLWGGGGRGDAPLCMCNFFILQSDGMLALLGTS